MEHLDLEHLMPFAARYVISAAMLRAGHQSDLERKLLDGIRQDADRFPRDFNLTQHFQSLGASIDTIRASYADELSPEFAVALGHAAEALLDHNCDRCEVEAICTRGVPTFDNVNPRFGGRCIAPVKTLFRQLRVWIWTMVRELPQPPVNPKVAVHFTTIHWNFHDDSELARQFSLGGYAVSFPEGEGHATRVSLAVREQSFGWAQFCMLPYVLLHEILCHAFQSLDVPDTRENAHSADAWSEGWMDRLALELAQEWIGRRALKLGLAPGPREDARQYMRQMHDFRYRPSLLPPFPEDEALPSLPSEGRDAFIEAMDAYQGPYAHMLQSRHPLTRFSLRLNAITLGRDFRVARVLQSVRYLARQDPAGLRRIVGAFNAEPNDTQAVERLDHALP